MLRLLAAAGVTLALNAPPDTAAPTLGAPPRDPCPLTLPGPSGPLPVGTRIVRLLREAEVDPAQQLIVQLWYPRPAAVAGATVPYLAEPELGPALLEAGYYQQDSTLLASWRCATVDAVRDAPVRQGRFPLVTLSVGLGLIRANYTLLAQDLASHGAVVAMVESPLAGMMIGADGRVVTDTSSTEPTAAEHRERVTGWVNDLRQVLAAARAGGPGFGALAGRIDWSTVTAIGHSSGGLVALQACESLPELRGCIDMDGGTVTPANEPLAAFVTAGVTRPVLILKSQPIYSDADLARRGLTRAQWLARAGAGLTAWDSLAARSRVPIRIVSVAGTAHMSYSDAPVVMPTTITRFGGTIIDPARGRAVIYRLISAFLEEVRTHRRGLLQRAVKELPEAKLRTIAGGRPKGAG